MLPAGTIMSAVRTDINCRQTQQLFKKNTMKVQQSDSIAEEEEENTSKRLTNRPPFNEIRVR